MISREDFEELSEKEQEEMVLKAIKKAYEETGSEVYETEGEFFTITEDDIKEISTDFGDGPKGGYYPDLIHGPDKEIADAIEAIMDKFNIEETFFTELYRFPEDYDLDTEDAYSDLDEENEKDKKTIEIIKAIQEMVKNGETPFKSVNDMAEVFDTFGLDPSVIYYKWDDIYIDLYDNICGCGETRGSLSGYDDYDWLVVLEDLDSYLVK